MEWTNVLGGGEARQRAWPGAGAGATADGQVAAFFAGKDVLVTGGSGFLGRVLVEKLLREAPDIGTIFLLVRPKRGVRALERLEKFTNVTLFDVVRRAQPAAMGKLHAVEGDIAQPGLGLSASDRALLEERVAVVFHSAASVRFNEPLLKAVRINVRGTQQLCEMALRMPRLQAFVHISTAYCNCNRLEIEEKLYPPPGDWRTYVEMVEKEDPRVLDFITPKLIGDRINTYIFTKAMGEQVVNYYSQQLPVGIIRPSVVTASVLEPFGGWLDNLNGVGATLLGTFTGALHVNYCRDSLCLDLIPVDYTVGGIVLMAVKMESNRESELIPVYNATSHNRYFIDPKRGSEDGHNISGENLLPRAYIRYGICIQSFFLYKLLFLLLELPISIFADIIAWFFNEPRVMLKIQKRVVATSMTTPHFTHHTFKFHATKFVTLNEFLSPEERKRYPLSTEFCLKEPYVLAFIKEAKYFFCPTIEINPGKTDRILETINLIICGILLLLLWKSSVVSFLTRLSFNVVNFLLVGPAIHSIFEDVFMY